MCDFIEPKCSDEATQRPGSTQNTDRSIGPDFGETIRSTPMTRSCLPPVTTSPASRSKGWSELLIRTRRFTSAPDCRGMGEPGRTNPRSEPASVTTTEPARIPSSSVSRRPVSFSAPPTTGKILRFPLVTGGRTCSSECTGLPAAANVAASMAEANDARIMKFTVDLPRRWSVSSNQRTLDSVLLASELIRFVQWPSFASAILAATFAAAGNPVHSELHVLPPVTKGNLSIFPVVGGAENDTGRLLTLDEGIRAGSVVVTEAGSLRGLVRPGSPMPRQSGAEMNRLVLIRSSDHPLLLLAGEVVTGGKQDRVIGVDRIV